MFFNLLKVRDIKYQIKVFLNWRKKQGMTTPGYEEWLSEFLRKTKKNDVMDVSVQDIEDFLECVAQKHSGQWPVIQAEKCLRQFVKFYSARGKMAGAIADYRESLYNNGVQLLANVKRNEDLVKRRLKNPTKWSWRRLGDYYGIHFTTAKQIFLRDVKRYSGAGELSTGIP